MFHWVNQKLLLPDFTLISHYSNLAQPFLLRAIRKLPPSQQIFHLKLCKLSSFKHNQHKEQKQRAHLPNYHSATKVESKCLYDENCRQIRIQSVELVVPQALEVSPQEYYRLGSHHRSRRHQSLVRTAVVHLVPGWFRIDPLTLFLELWGNRFWLNSYQKQHFKKSRCASQYISKGDVLFNPQK